MTEQPKQIPLMITVGVILAGIVVFVAAFILAWWSLGLSPTASMANIFEVMRRNFFALGLSALLIAAGLVLAFLSLSGEQKVLAVKTVSIVLSGGLIVGAPYVDWLLEKEVSMPWPYAITISLVIFATGIALLTRFIKREEKAGS